MLYSNFIRVGYYFNRQKLKMDEGFNQEKE